MLAPSPQLVGLVNNVRLQEHILNILLFSFVYLFWRLRLALERLRKAKGEKVKLIRVPLPIIFLPFIHHLVVVNAFMVVPGLLL